MSKIGKSIEKIDKWALGSGGKGANAYESLGVMKMSLNKTQLCCV